MQTHSLPGVAIPGATTLPQGCVVLRPEKWRAVAAGHPWIWHSSIDRVEGAPADGQVVDVLSDTRQFLARGIYNSKSRLRVRLYSWSAERELDAAFWHQTLASAIGWRRQLQLLEGPQATRLVFSEGDQLSGLIVDKYAEYLVIQVNALAMAVRFDVILEALLELLRPKGVYVRTAAETCKWEGLPLFEGCVWGEVPQQPVRIVESGVVFDVDVSQGQKTGHYIDQRDNRRAAAVYLRGRRVLDVFCYSGGFALHALSHGGAIHVTGVDSSQKALDAARHNAALNGLEQTTEWIRADAFDYLDALRSDGRRFDAVILDPPKFARNRAHVAEALRAYHRLNRLAVELLVSDGVLVTCSCSGTVTRNDFHNMLQGVAEKTRRVIQVIEQRGHSADHPIWLACPETEYLKCFICRVL